MRGVDLCVCSALGFPQLRNGEGKSKLVT
jgi:hypothetical protein